MPDQYTTRMTLEHLQNGVYRHNEHTDLADYGMRRYHPFSFDFDSTPLDLSSPDPNWDEGAKAAHNQRQRKRVEALGVEYGSRNIEQIIENVRELGAKGMSLVTHHNLMHAQARHSFVVGSYYPALVAASALGERILNHLVLDLRDSFKASPHFKKLHRKDSLDDWPFVVAVLQDWKVLIDEDEVGRHFLALGAMRNRSIHFNPETYTTMREDALSALQLLGKIISKQFGYFGGQPWFIENIPGAQFVKRSYEVSPFVKTYIIPKSGFVGPLYGMELAADGFWRHLDYADYGDGSVTDEEFAEAIRERDPRKVVTREMIEHQDRIAKR